ncbi:hypothetical protein [Lacimonas salitolerans]|uniref:Ca2+-binding protein, RTX toxin-related n=1 Tax=Lacimonas salitolerans TaxID=1323750 RepID=A0ABW4EIC1_9RHOB
MAQIDRYEANVALVAADSERLSSSLQALDLAQITAEAALNLPDTLANRLETRSSAIRLNQTIVNVLDGLPYGIGFAVRQIDRVSDSLGDALGAQVRILRNLGDSWDPVRTKVEFAGILIGTANTAVQPVQVSLQNRVTELELLRDAMGSEMLPASSDIIPRMAEFNLSAEAWQEVRQTALDLLPSIDALARNIEDAGTALRANLPSLAQLDARLDSALGVFQGAANTLRNIYDSLNININLGFTRINLISAIDTIASFAGFIQNTIEGIVIDILERVGFNTNIFGGVENAVLSALNPLFAQFAGLGAATAAILEDLQALISTVTTQIEAAFLAIAEAIGIDTLFANEYAAPDGGIMVISNPDSEYAIFGGSGNDTLRGGAATGDLFVFGAEGDDYIESGAGDDELFGNAGDDTLNGGAGDNLLIGGPGIDTAVYTGLDLADIALSVNGDLLIIAAPDGTDRVQGVEFFTFDDGVRSLADLLNGAPRALTGTGGDDLITGFAGNDTIRGGAGDDTINAGSGFDLVYGGMGDDLVRGLNGFDTLHGDRGNDTLLGNAGNDLLFGGAGDDLLNGGIGFDEMHGGLGNDTLAGLEGFDTLYGGSGNDSLQGNAGNDVLYGGGGADRLEGGIGADMLHGDAGNDLLFGGSGFDVQYGGAGNDTVYGNAGNDTLDGGAGNDLLFGGLGADTFIFGVGYDHDRIADFQTNIDIINLHADLLGSGNPAATDLIPFAGRTADGFLILDFGDGDTLTFAGVTNTGAILDNVVFV